MVSPLNLDEEDRLSRSYSGESGILGLLLPAVNTDVFELTDLLEDVIVVLSLGLYPFN